MAPRYDVIDLGLDGVLHDVNSRGESVGQTVTVDGATCAVSMTAGGVTMLGTLGGSASSARGINDAGAIVGGSLAEGDLSHRAFLYEDGVMHDLNDLIAPGAGYELVHALGISNKGDIVALGHRDGADRVVLLKRRDSDVAGN